MEIERTKNLGAQIVKVKGKSERTTAAYRAAVSAFVKSGKPATVDGFAAYIHDLKGKRSASTVNQHLAAGRLAFLQAGRRLRLPAYELAAIKGSLASIPSVRKVVSEVSVVSPDERAKLLAALPLRIRLIAETLYVSGARVSEILGVRRDLIQVNEGVSLRLLGKGSKERLARLPMPLYARILKEYPQGRFLFYTKTGAPFHREYVSREIARAARRVLGRSIGAHTLRHSRATDLLQETGRIKAVSKLLGHADEATTLRFYVKDSFNDAELFAGIAGIAAPSTHSVGGVPW
jgi:integrase